MIDKDNVMWFVGAVMGLPFAIMGLTAVYAITKWYYDRKDRLVDTNIERYKKNLERKVKK